jgi:hypothetical protein
MNLRGKMNEMKETTILQEGNVKITNQRVLIGTDTYGVSNIRAVTITRPARNKRPLLLIPLGSLLAYWSAITDGQFIEFFNIGIVLVIAGIVIFVAVKPAYTIHFETTSGRIGIMNTMDTSLTHRIVDATNTSIAWNKQIELIGK